MRAYYGSRISEHMTKTPEGFLICHNVPIARTGRQDYLPQEIGMEGSKLVSVIRTDEEVFSPQAIASFEGKSLFIISDQHAQLHHRESRKHHHTMQQCRFRCDWTESHTCRRHAVL